MDGRAKRRLMSKRRIQEVALDLFEERGFDAVPVEEIAARAEVGPATVYRSFQTKERIVLWDEYDPALFEGIAARLRELPVLDAVEAALAASLDRIYREDKERILRRSRLILSHPSLAAASAADRATMRQGLAGLLLETRAAPSALAADVTAGAVVAALEAAVEHWVRAEGRAALKTLLARAFKHLRELDEVTAKGAVPRVARGA